MAHPALCGLTRQHLGELIEELAPRWEAHCDSGRHERRRGGRRRQAGAGPRYELVFTDHVLITLVYCGLGSLTTPCRCSTKWDLRASAVPSARSAHCWRCAGSPTDGHDGPTCPDGGPDRRRSHPLRRRACTVNAEKASRPSTASTATSQPRHSWTTPPRSGRCRHRTLPSGFCSIARTSNARRRTGCRGRSRLV